MTIFQKFNFFYNKKILVSKRFSFCIICNSSHMHISYGNILPLSAVNQTEDNRALIRRPTSREQQREQLCSPLSLLNAKLMVREWR